MTQLLRLKSSHDAGIKSMILTGSPDEVETVAEQYRRFAPRNGHRPHLGAVGGEESARREIRLVKRQPDILVGTPARIIDHLRRDNLSLNRVECVVLDVPEDAKDSGFDKDVLFIYSKLAGLKQTIAFVGNLAGSLAFDTILKRPQQIARSDWHNDTKHEEQSVSDNDHIGNAITELIRRLKENESPEMLNYYRKEYRRKVPFHLRGYMSALLLKEYLGTQDETSTSNVPGKKTLFVSIGKNRRVFPKDLIKHFADRLGIDSEEIGAVKILDNYSFIEIPALHADRAIKELNETEFRGRKIAVNHARKKR